LGDVVLAAETVRAESAERGIEPVDHLRHLVVHGVLHLVGWDHDTEAAAAEMEGLETELLAGIGVADPYAHPAEA
jgi:probable rRNA maturation factor